MCDEMTVSQLRVPLGILSGLVQAHLQRLGELPCSLKAGVTVLYQGPIKNKVTETFDPEHENPEEMQRAGWQAILENFKKYVEFN